MTTRARRSSLLAALALVAAATGVQAFTFSDGSTGICTTQGAKVTEYEAPADEPIVQGRTAITVPDAGGYIIVWNPARLKALPPVMRDFLFFHECAHARMRTQDESVANCNGLKDMRAAGRAGPEVEAQLAAFYGAGSNYWTGTLRCANEKAPDGVPPSR
jgi:hypothetical protein